MKEAASDGSDCETVPSGDPFNPYKIIGWEAYRFKPYSDFGTYDHLDIDEVEYESLAYDWTIEEDTCFSFREAKKFCEVDFKNMYRTLLGRMMITEQRRRLKMDIKR